MWPCHAPQGDPKSPKKLLLQLLSNRLETFKICSRDHLETICFFRILIKAFKGAGGGGGGLHQNSLEIDLIAVSGRRE